MLAWQSRPHTSLSHNNVDVIESCGFQCNQINERRNMLPTPTSVTAPRFFANRSTAASTGSRFEIYIVGH